MVWKIWNNERVTDYELNRNFNFLATKGEYNSGPLTSVSGVCSTIIYNGNENISGILLSANAKDIGSPYYQIIGSGTDNVILTGSVRIISAGSLNPSIAVSGNAVIYSKSDHIYWQHTSGLGLGSEIGSFAIPGGATNTQILGYTGSELVLGKTNSPGAGSVYIYRMSGLTTTINGSVIARTVNWTSLHDYQAMLKGGSYIYGKGGNAFVINIYNGSEYDVGIGSSLNIGDGFLYDNNNNKLLCGRLVNPPNTTAICSGIFGGSYYYTYNELCKSNQFGINYNDGNIYGLSGTNTQYLLFGIGATNYSIKIGSAIELPSATDKGLLFWINGTGSIYNYTLKYG